jgi:5,10-methenyltetrahydromethanopterin hydrogenase
MEVKDCILKLAKEEFGKSFVDVDFFGPYDSEDMMGEIILRNDIADDEVIMKLYSITRRAEEQGWQICLSWVTDESAAEAL